MKTIHVALLCTISCVHYAQSQNLIEKGTYRFVDSEVGDQSPQKILNASEVEIVKGHKIRVISYSSDRSKVIYRYLPFNENYWVREGKFKKKIKKSSDYATRYNNKVFEMDTANFRLFTNPIYSRYKGVSVGVYTVPFRLRDIGGRYFDFESSLSLQSNVIFGFGTTKKSHSLFDVSIGIGLTGVTIDSLNSNLSATEGSRSASALTWSVGMVFKPSPYANFGVFLGSDYLLLKDKGLDWVYQGKGWIGVGVNISFNKVDTDNTAKKVGAQNTNK